MKLVAHRLAWLVGCCALGGIQTPASEPAQIKLDLDHWLIVEGDAELERKKYFNVHGTPATLSDDEREFIVKELGCSFGRSLGRLSTLFRRVGEDAERPGHLNTKALSTTFRSISASQNDYDLIESSHPSAFFRPVGEEERFVPATPEAAAEAVVDYLRQSPQRPRYFEVTNEPNVHMRELQTTWENVCDVHTAIARKVHQEVPEVLVGGPASAYPAFELKDFMLWNKHMGPFIERTAADLDFLSIHLYTTHWDEKVNYRYGGNFDAILDLMANKAQLVTGKQTPLVISECGRGFRKGERIHEEYSPERDWLVITGANHTMFGLARRGGAIAKAIPFIVLKPSWYQGAGPYPWALYHRHEDGWTPTHLQQWFRFWRNASGRRLPVRSSDGNLQALAVSDGSEVNLYLDNLWRRPRTFEAKLPGLAAGTIEVRRLQLVEGVPRIQSERLEAQRTMRLTVGAEEAMHLRWTPNYKLAAEGELEQRTSYGDQILKKYDEQPLLIQIPCDQRSTPAMYATLRIAVCRLRAEWEAPTIRFNDQLLRSQPIERGDGETLVAEKFATFEYPVPGKWIREKNKISAKFSSPGGRVATAALVVTSPVVPSDRLSQSKGARPYSSRLAGGDAPGPTDPQKLGGKEFRE